MANAIIPDNLHLIQINWVNQNTVISPKKFKNNPNYDFQVSYNMMHNLDKEIVKIGLFIDMSGEVEGKTINQGGNYEIDFLFKIDDMQSHYQIIDNKAIFDGVFVGTLLGVSYSTVRGMLFNSWKDTVLEKVILPIISIPELLKSKR